MEGECQCELSHPHVNTNGQCISCDETEHWDSEKKICSTTCCCGMENHQETNTCHCPAVLPHLIDGKCDKCSDIKGERTKFVYLTRTLQDEDTDTTTTTASATVVLEKEENDQKEGECICPDNSHTIRIPDADHDTCLICDQPGFLFFNSATLRCEPDCNGGQVFDPITGDCNCPKDQVLIDDKCYDGCPTTEKKLPELPHGCENPIFVTDEPQMGSLKGHELLKKCKDSATKKHAHAFTTYSQTSDEIKSLCAYCIDHDLKTEKMAIETIYLSVGIEMSTQHVIQRTKYIFDKATNKGECYCPDETPEWSETMQTCKVCNEDYPVFNKERGWCEKNCHFGMKWNARRQRCTCAKAVDRIIIESDGSKHCGVCEAPLAFKKEGSTESTDEGVCDCPDPSIMWKGTCIECVKPKDQLDPITGKCTATCTGNKVWDKELQKCVCPKELPCFIIDDATDEAACSKCPGNTICQNFESTTENTGAPHEITGGPIDSSNPQTLKFNLIYPIHTFTSLDHDPATVCICQCPTDKPYRAGLFEDGNCIACNEPKERFDEEEQKCVSNCDYEGQIKNDNDECQCPDSLHLIDTEQKNMDIECTACSEPTIFFVPDTPSKPNGVGTCQCPANTYSVTRKTKETPAVPACITCAAPTPHFNEATQRCEGICKHGQVWNYVDNKCDCPRNDPETPHYVKDGDEPPTCLLCGSNGNGLTRFEITNVDTGEGECKCPSDKPYWGYSEKETDTENHDMCKCTGNGNEIQCSVTGQRYCASDEDCNGKDEVEFGEWSKICKKKNPTTIDEIMGEDEHVEEAKEETYDADAAMDWFLELKSRTSLSSSMSSSVSSPVASTTRFASNPTATIGKIDEMTLRSGKTYSTKSTQSEVKECIACETKETEFNTLYERCTPICPSNGQILASDMISCECPQETPHLIRIEDGSESCGVCEAPRIQFEQNEQICVCPNGQEYGQKTNVCVGPCVAPQEYNSVKELCEEPPKVCENGKINAPDGMQEGCVCPEDKPHMIGDVCAACVAPKTNFISINEPADEVGECRCPESAIHYNKVTNECIHCGEGDEWIFDTTIGNNGGECRKECGDQFVWTLGTTGVGSCACPKEKPHNVHGKCVNCADNGARNIFFEMNCLQIDDDSDRYKSTKRTSKKFETATADCSEHLVKGGGAGTACADTPGCRKQTKPEFTAFKKLKSTKAKYPNAKKVPKQCVPEAGATTEDDTENLFLEIQTSTFASTFASTLATTRVSGIDGAPCGVCGCPSKTPYFNAPNDQCLQCDDPLKPHWDFELMECISPCSGGSVFSAENGDCICNAPMIWSEAKKQCMQGCPEARPLVDVQTGKCRRKRYTDCNPPFIDPLSQKCVKGTLTEVTWQKRATKFCEMYLSGELTYREMQQVATGAYQMNNNKLPMAVAEGKMKNVGADPTKAPGYKDITKNWRGPAGDARAYTYNLPPHCQECMSQTPFQKESNGKFSTCADTGPNACQCNNRYDPHHECPHYQDLDDEGMSMYVTLVSAETWQSSCKSLHTSSNTKNPVDADWKCKLKIPKSLVEHGIPVPLPRFKVPDSTAFWICPAPWIGTLSRSSSNRKGVKPSKKKESSGNKVRFQSRVRIRGATERKVVTATDVISIPKVPKVIFTEAQIRDEQLEEKRRAMRGTV